MEVKNEIRLYAIDDVPTKVGEETKLVVTNVWNKPQLVRVRVGNGSTVIVKASDLIKAISNSTGNG